MVLTLEDLLSFDTSFLSGKRVFIRSDLNVPMENGVISEDTRIRASLPAIRMCLVAGARVMVTSHFGRPEEGKWTPESSLEPVAKHMELLLERPVRLIRDWVDGGFEVEQGTVVLLENCRLNKGEKKNDPVLSKKMGALCDIYVNDAFGTAHRAEATTAGMVPFCSIRCAGPLLSDELYALSRTLSQPDRPSLAIVGGSKVSTKLTILQSIITKVDELIVGGGIANTFLLAKGYNIGKSLCEPDLVQEAKKIINAMGCRLHLPSDVIVATTFSADAVAVCKPIDQVADDDMILDVGPETSKELYSCISRMKTIIWNGPLGVFEWDSFSHGTEQLCSSIRLSPSYCLAGGGDTLAAIAKYKMEKRINYISTGGGAFLECLEGKTLPAVAALDA